MKVGLRFDTKDAALLERLAERVRSHDLPGYVEQFTQPANAARTGEPLQLQCSDVEEAHRMVALYVELGCTPPAVEALND